MDTRTGDLSFYGKDPGATRFGNFINYYSFHSANERLKHINKDMFPEFDQTDIILILDIGCNTGDLTVSLHEYLKDVYLTQKIFVLAIDIDPALINRANEKETSNITFLTCNVMTESGQQILKDYLDQYGKTSFDITFCFSVTMWIHINNGDEKFLEFLNNLKYISKCIIIEPQPWKCYKNAQRRMKRAGTDFSLFNIINIRENIDQVIEQVLSDKTHQKIYESQSSSWNRKIQSYHIIKSNSQ